MAQMGFFDLSDRYASLDAKKDPLVNLHSEVTRVFHRELTRLKVMFCGLCWGQGMCGLLLFSGGR